MPALRRPRPLLDVDDPATDGRPLAPIAENAPLSIADLGTPALPAALAPQEPASYPDESRRNVGVPAAQLSAPPPPPVPTGTPPAGPAPTAAPGPLLPAASPQPAPLPLSQPTGTPQAAPMPVRGLRTAAGGALDLGMPTGAGEANTGVNGGGTVQDVLNSTPPPARPPASPYPDESGRGMAAPLPIAALTTLQPPPPAVAAAVAARSPAGAMQRAAGAATGAEPAVTTTPAPVALNLGADGLDHSSREGFIRSMLPFAQAAAQATGIPAEVFLAIPLNEQGWQRPAPGNNYYGIKGQNPTTGRDTGPVGTWEVIDGKTVNILDRFRAYDHPGQGMLDFAQFLKDNPRYQHALQVLQQTRNPVAFIQAVKDAGYATDPLWPRKIAALMSDIAGIAQRNPVSNQPAPIPGTDVPPPTHPPPGPTNAPAPSPERTRQVASGFAWGMAQKEALQRITDQKTALQNQINSGQMTVEQAQAHMDFVLKREEDYLMTRPIAALSSHQTLTGLPGDTEQPEMRHVGRLGGHEEPPPGMMTPDERAQAANEQFAQENPLLGALQAGQRTEAENRPAFNPFNSLLQHVAGELAGAAQGIPLGEGWRVQSQTVKQNLENLDTNVLEPFLGMIQASAQQAGTLEAPEAGIAVPVGGSAAEAAEEAVRQRYEMYRQTAAGGDLGAFNYAKNQYQTMSPEQQQLMKGLIMAADPGMLASAGGIEALGVMASRLPQLYRIGVGSLISVGLYLREQRAVAEEAAGVARAVPRLPGTVPAEFTGNVGPGGQPIRWREPIRPLEDILRETGGALTPEELAAAGPSRTRYEPGVGLRPEPLPMRMSGAVDVAEEPPSGYAIPPGGRSNALAHARELESQIQESPVAQQLTQAMGAVETANLLRQVGVANNWRIPEGVDTDTAEAYNRALSAAPPFYLAEDRQNVLARAGIEATADNLDHFEDLGNAALRLNDIRQADRRQFPQDYGQQPGLPETPGGPALPVPAVGAPRQPETIEFVRQSLRLGAQPESFTLPSGTPGAAPGGGQPDVTVRDRQTVELPFTISQGNRRTETPSTEQGVRTVGDTYAILNKGDREEPWYLVNRQTGQVERNGTFKTQELATQDAIRRLVRGQGASVPSPAGAAAPTAGAVSDYSPAEQYVSQLSGGLRRGYAEQRLAWVRAGRVGSEPPAVGLTSKSAQEIRGRLDSLTKGLAVEPQAPQQTAPATGLRATHVDTVSGERVQVMKGMDGVNLIRWESGRRGSEPPGPLSSQFQPITATEELGNAGTTAGATGAEPGVSAAQPGAPDGTGADRNAGAAPAGVQEAGPGAAPQPAAAAEGGGLPEAGGKSPEQRDVDRTGLGGGDPAGPVGAAGRLAQVSPPSPSGAHDLQMDAAEIARIAAASPVVRADANLDALETLVSLYRDGRAGRSTPAEQIALSLFSGWGDSGFNPMFPRDDFMRSRQDASWQDREQRLLRLAEELKTYMGEDVARALARSRLNAHYTPPHIVDAMYGIASWLGIHNLNQIRMLEPAAGSGRFVGLMPVELAARSERTLVELDKATGAMLRELFPNSTVYGGVGYEQAPIADNSQDLIITNVPFGDYGMSDPALRKRGAFSNLSIHNQFVVKNNDKLRPGGVQIIITSHHTMDAPTMTRFRAQLAASADLIGAIRLPEKAFRDTDVATDILVLQKRFPGQQPNGIPWAETETLSLPAGSPNLPSYQQYNVDQSVNQYFVDHPEMALGEHSSRGKMNAKDLYTLEARPGENLETALRQAISELEPNILTDVQHIDDAPRTGSRDMTGAKEGSWVVQDGELLQKEQGLLVRREITPEQDTRIRAMLEVRDAARRLHAAELGASTDAELAPLRDELNRSYDNFYGTFGPLNLKANTDLMRLDPDGPWLRGLEKWSKERGAEYRKKGFAPGPSHRDAIKADFFRRRVSKGEDADRRIASPTDALLVALNDVGRLDFEYMGSLLGRPGVEVRNDLARSGLIFRNPTGGWETADQYLSGDVRGKLRAAELAAQQNQAYQANVEALTVVQPPDLPPSQIPIKLGAHWIPASDVNAFVREITGYFRRGGEFFRYVAQSGKWIQEVAPWMNDFDRGLMNDKWGTPSMSAMEIVADLLNNKTIEVTERVDGKPVVLVKPTEAARAKADEIQQEFAQWVWRDPERSARLSRYYNDNFNNIRNVEADGSHLTLLGMAPEWAAKARSLQLGAIWRGIRDGVVGVYHGVGFGKTLTIVAMGMEMKRLGLSPKNLYVVPKITHAQFREQFRQYYPNANVLFPEEDDFAGANLPVFLSRIAANDWDAVILSDSQFDRMPFSEQMQTKFVQEELDELEGALRQMEEVGGDEAKKSRSYKEIQKALARADKQMKDLQHALESREVARTLTFDQLGISMMFVDEAHRYKNLRFRSSLEGVKGLGTAVNGKGAQRAWKMYQATRWMQDTHGGRGVALATGTPVTNTLAEVWTMMRFLQHRQLVERGLEHFDAWMNTYGRVTADWEQTVQGTYKVTARLREVVGLPELSRLWQLTADIRTDVETPVLTDLQPRVIEDSPGARTVIRAEPDELYKDYLKDIIRRVAALDPRRPDLDNMLSITTDGRKASIDMRLVDPRAPVNPQGKLAKLVETLVDVYHQEQTDKGTQAVFLDMGVPKASDKDDPADTAEDVELEESAEEKATSRSLYAWIKDMLLQQGIPENEIAFIQEANTPGKRVTLLDKFNRGDIRFLLGTTASMSMGLNIQERLAAMHMLSPDWTPDMLRQKEGRGIRPGNVVYGPTLDEAGKVIDKGRGIKIFRYVTQGAGDVNSFDAYGWGLLETKARSFDAAVRRDVTVRSVEDVSAGALGADVAVSIATNNPDYLTLQKLTAEILKLSFVKAAHNDAVIHARQEVASIPGQMQRREEEVTRHQQDLAHLNANSPKGQITLTVGGQTFEKREDAGKALIATLPATMMTGQVTEPIAVYRGFQVQWKKAPPLGTLRKDAYDLILTGPSGERYDTNYVERDELNANGILTRLDTPLNNIEGRITYARERNASQARELETYKKQAMAESPVDARLARMEAERDRLQRRISGAEVEDLPEEEAQVPPTGVEEAAPEIMSVEPGPESQPLPPAAPAYTDEQLDSLGTGGEHTAPVAGNAPPTDMRAPEGAAVVPEPGLDQAQQPTVAAEEPPAPPAAEPQVEPTLAGGVPAEPSPITPEAEALLEKVADGGVPAVITRRIVKIAEDNGIPVNDKTTPNEIVQGLEAKVREQLPKAATPQEPTLSAPAEIEPVLSAEPAPAGGTAATLPDTMEQPLDKLGLARPGDIVRDANGNRFMLGGMTGRLNDNISLLSEDGSTELGQVYFTSPGFTRVRRSPSPTFPTQAPLAPTQERPAATAAAPEPAPEQTPSPSANASMPPAAPPAPVPAQPQPVEIQNLLRQDAQQLQQQADEAMTEMTGPPSAPPDMEGGGDLGQPPGEPPIPLGPQGSTGVGQPGQERTFANSVRTGAGTDSDLADLLDKMRINRSEEVRNTEAAILAARARIQADPQGGDGVYRRIMGTRPQDLRDDDIFDGMVLVDYMAQQQSVLRAAGDFAGADDLLQKAWDLTEKLAIKGLRAGQEVQAFSGWDRLSPTGQLMMMQRELMQARGRYDPRTGKYEHQQRVTGHLAEIAEQQAKEQYEGKLKQANDEISRMQKEIEDLNEQAANAKKGATQTARGQKGGGKAAKAETKASQRLRKTLAGKLEYLIKQGRAPGRLPALPDEDMRVFNRMMTLAQETGWLMPLQEGLDLVQEAEDIAKLPKEFRRDAIHQLADRMRAPGGYLETLEERAQDFRHLNQVERAIERVSNRGRQPGRPSPLMEGEQVILREFTKTADEVGYVMGPAQRQAFLDAVDTLEKMPDSPMRDQAYRDLVRTIGDTYLPSLYAERDRLREERKAAEQRAANLKYLIDTAERETKPRLKKDYEEATRLARANAKAGKIAMPVSLAETFLDRADRVKKLPEGSPERYLAGAQLMADAAAVTPPDRLLRLLDTLNLPRTFMTMWDLSAPFNQGRFMLFGQPKIWGQAWIPMMHALADARFSAEYDAMMHTDPDFAIINGKMKVRISPRGVESHILDREDQWLGRAGVSDKNTVMRYVGPDAWEDAYLTFVNGIRFWTAKRFIRDATAAGYALSDRELEDLGNLINISTGYGWYPERLKGIGGVLASIYFSPRGMAATLERLASVTKASFSLIPGAQRIGGGRYTYSRRVAWEYGQLLGRYYLVMGMVGAGLIAASGTVVLDPTRTDFGDAKLGPIRIPLFPQEQAIVRMAWQLWKGGRTTSAGDFRKQTWAQTLATYIQGQTAPHFGFLMDLARQQDAIGRRVALGEPAAATGIIGDTEQLFGVPLRNWFGPAGSVTSDLIEHMAPMTVQGFLQGVGNNVGAAWNSLNVGGGFFGIRTQANQNMTDVRDAMARRLFPDDTQVQQRGYAGANQGMQHQVDESPTVMEKITEEYGDQSGRHADLEQTSIAAGVLYRDGTVRMNSEAEKVLPTITDWTAIAKYVKDFKDQRFKLAQDTIANPMVQQYRQEGKALPDLRIEDVLAEKYWSAQPGTDVNGGLDWKVRDKIRQEALDEAKQQGVAADYIKGSGPGSYRGDRFKGYPQVQKWVNAYEDAQELTQPYWQYRDRLLEVNPMIQQAIDQSQAAAKSGNWSMANSIMAMGHVQAYVEALKLYRMNNPKVERAGELLGYFKPLFPQVPAASATAAPARRP